MNLIWGAILIIFTGILCWLGQVINASSPSLAVRLGLDEPEADIDPTFFVDGRGEAFWDTVTLWILPVAGILLIFNSPWWAYFGLVGGGMYLYFAGRGIAVRLVMQRREIRIGKPETLKVVYVFLTLWGLIAIITIIMAVVALPLQPLHIEIDSEMRCRVEEKGADPWVFIADVDFAKLAEPSIVDVF